MPICQNCGNFFAEGEACPCGEPMQAQTSPYMTQVGETDAQGLSTPAVHAETADMSDMQAFMRSAVPPELQGYRQADAAQEASQADTNRRKRRVLAALIVGFAGVFAAVSGAFAYHQVGTTSRAIGDKHAKACHYAVAEAAAACRAEGVVFEEPLIVSNLYGTDFGKSSDLEAIHDKIDAYSDADEDYYYFAVLEDGNCTYAVAWSESELGTYPATAGSSFYGFDGEPYFLDEESEEGIEAVVSDLYHSAWERMLDE